MDNDSIELEILEASYWQHFHHLKEISFYMPIDDPKRQNLDKIVNELSDKINEIKNKSKK